MQNFEELILPYVDKVVDKNNEAIYHYKLKDRMIRIRNINRMYYDPRTDKRAYRKTVIKNIDQQGESWDQT